MLQYRPRQEKPSAQPGRSSRLSCSSLCTPRSSALGSSSPHRIPQSSPRTSSASALPRRVGSGRATGMGSLAARGSCVRAPDRARQPGRGLLGMGTEGQIHLIGSGHSSKLLISIRMRRYVQRTQSPDASMCACSTTRGGPAHPHRGRLRLTSPAQAAEQEPHP